MTLSFCPALEEIYGSQRTVGQTGKVFDNLGALSTLNNLLVLRALMMERKPARTLEVGLSFGGSALTIAASHRDLGRPGDRQHVAIDPYQATVWDNCAVQSLNQAGLGGYVDVRQQYSSVALAAIFGEQQTFDLIYVDGSHLFEDVFVDAYFGFQLLSQGGVMLFDDCSIDHVAKVLKFVRASWQGWTEELDLSPYRANGQSLRYKIGKQLGKTQLRAFQRTAAGPRSWDAPFDDF